jgi:spermidine synthase
VFENPTLGRVLVLDGIVQISERDEFIYHEMMAHVPLVAHGGTREVLIIGGGDGGTLEEVLKHPGVERAVMVELDSRVVEIARTHLPDVSRGAFDDPRSELIFSDGAAFVAETERRFDVILIDSTDPTGPGEVLFSRDFYANCRRSLRPGGILVAQSGNPSIEQDRYRQCYGRLSKVFADAGFYLSSVPTYMGGPFAFAWASDDTAKRFLTAARLAERWCPPGLRCYSPEVHAAAFVLPPWLVPTRLGEGESAPAAQEEPEA